MPNRERHTFSCKHHVRLIVTVHLLPPSPGAASQQHLNDTALVDVVVDKFPVHTETGGGEVKSKCDALAGPLGADN